MSISYQNSFYALGKEIFMYQLPDGKHGYWYCRFTNPMSKGRYIRKSLKTANQGLAIKRAIDLYNDIHTKHRIGGTLAETTWDKIVDTFAKERVESGKVAIKKFNKAYWSKYFNNPKYVDDLFQLNDWHITAYWEWRLNFWKDNPDERKFYHQSDGIHISESYVRDERTHLNWLLKRAFERRIIARMPLMPQVKKIIEGSDVVALPRNRRRIKFEKQYSDTIVPALNRYRKLLSMSDDDLKTLIGGNRKHPEFWILQSRNRFATSMVWVFLLTISNTGIRPQELKKIRWRDISTFIDDDGNQYTKIDIKRNVSKVGIFRDVIARDFLETYNRLMIYKKEWIRFWGESNWHEDRLVFTNIPIKIKKDDNGKRVYVDEPRELYNPVRRLHKRIGIHEEIINGRKIFATAYSYRSYAISQRLKHGLDIYVASKLYGTSIKMLCQVYDYSENMHYVNKITAHTIAESGNYKFDGKIEGILNE